MNKRYSILDFILNEAPYGGSMYGIQEGTKHISHHAASTTLAQRAYLAALPNAPTLLFSVPVTIVSNWMREKISCFRRMLENKILSRNRSTTPQKKKWLVFKPEWTGITAPHIVLFVKNI